MKLTKREAEKVMRLDLGPNTSERIEHYCGAHADAALTFNGCKLYREKRGCVSTYRMHGYAPNEEDAIECLQAAGVFRPFAPIWKYLKF